MKMHFSSDVSVSLTIDKDSLELLKRLASHHYDGVCRAALSSASINGSKNGFLTIWEMSPTESDNNVFNIFKATFSDIDTSLKITEAYHGLINDEEHEKINSMRKMFIDILKMINFLQKEWQSTDYYLETIE